MDTATKRIAALEKKGVFIQSGKEIAEEWWYKEYEAQDLWFAVSEKWYVLTDEILASFDKVEDALNWCEQSSQMCDLLKFNGWDERNEETRR